MFKLENDGDAAVAEHLHPPFVEGKKFLSKGRFCLEYLVLLRDVLGQQRMALGPVRGEKFCEGCSGMSKGEE